MTGKATRRIIIGVMGGGSGSDESLAMARTLGRQIATRGWVLLNGGRNAGVMAASAQGAAEADGLTIGILPDSDAADAAPCIQIPIVTGMGSARNLINVLSADVVIACPGGPGTISEVALALKYGKPVVCMGWTPGRLFQTFEESGQLRTTQTPDETVALTARLLSTIRLPSQR
ncbi:MAG: TIGR00725 family protein [Desulfosarcinaceae bacterium]|nr:TIGR00725 family protein [Desulfosarcinaceae bacterium]